MTVTGTHAIEEMLKRRLPDGTMLLLSRRGGKTGSLANVAGRSVSVRFCSDSELSAHSASHNGAVLIVPDSAACQVPRHSVREYCDALGEGGRHLVVVLDGVTDPHNLGAVLRSADCFAVDLVMIPKNGSVKVNETVLRVSSGAASHVRVAESVNLARDLELLKKNGFWVYAADMGGEAISDVVFDDRSVFIFGREGEGLHRGMRDASDFLVSIPNRGHVDSLNVSVASALFMYDFAVLGDLKKRRKNGSA